MSSIQQLRNKPGKQITKNDFETALSELKNINDTINVIGYDVIDDVLHITIEITVEKGGFVKERLKFGQLINLVETSTSTEYRKKIIDETDIKNKKRLESARKAAQTRAAKKPENNITKDSQHVSFANMISWLVDAHTDNDYDSRFIRDISTKTKLTAKQHNYLCKVASKHGFSMPEKKVRAATKKQVISCQHEDLGSLGYTHGETVKCPFCGKMAEVW